MVNEDANGKLIRELKEEINRLRDLLKAEGIEVGEGKQFFFNLNSSLKNCSIANIKNQLEIFSHHSPSSISTSLNSLLIYVFNFSLSVIN